ncbi:uncharacterized protein LOC132284429 [Cornus florida]|uniref:uncharacterized protein LOC132284429 n=1 Tax=Cornus florida TaxID=4283 RepID=UPI00289D99A7|nr:uncharacterized protein LOC132284429 [Cornus florida]
MAARWSPSPPPMIQRSAPTKKPISRVLMLSGNQNPVKKKPLQITSCFRDKVFEDQSRGIVCYRDSSGDIVCEGYDEGPRFQQEISRITDNTRDVPIIDLPQKTWLQIVLGGESNHPDKGVAVKKNFNRKC